MLQCQCCLNKSTEVCNTNLFHRCGKIENSLIYINDDSFSFFPFPLDTGCKFKAQIKSSEDVQDVF